MAGKQLEQLDWVKKIRKQLAGHIGAVREVV